MNTPNTPHRPRIGTLPPIVAFLLSGAGCGWVNNVSSEVNCADYCAKDYNCDDMEPTNEEMDDCTNACRDSIEDNCGNEHQGEANAQIADCVDMSCTEFRTCMVFEAAPACFDFVDN